MVLEATVLEAAINEESQPPAGKDGIGAYHSLLVGPDRSVDEEPVCSAFKGPAHR